MKSEWCLGNLGFMVTYAGYVQVPQCNIILMPSGILRSEDIKEISALLGIEILDTILKPQIIQIGGYVDALPTFLLAFREHCDMVMEYLPLGAVSKLKQLYPPECHG